MDKLFNELRGKPPQVKTRILYITTVVVMVVVVVVWLLTLSDRFDNFSLTNEIVDSGVVSSFTDFWTLLTEKTSDIIGSVSEFKELIPSGAGTE